MLTDQTPGAPPARPSPVAPAPSELREGWLLIVASSIGVALSSIVLPYYTIGTLVKPLTQAFGWTRADVQSAILFSTGLGALTAPVVGALIDRYGPRRLALPCIIGLSSGFFIAASMSGSRWMLYLSYGCIALLGAGTTPVTWTRAIASSFSRQRGLALGLTLAGTGVCAILVPQYTNWLVTHYGWRTAYVGLGLLPLVISLPIAVIGFRPRDRAPAATPSAPVVRPVPGLTLAAALRTPRFWVLLLSILLIYLSTSGLVSNLVPALTDMGFTSQQAANAQSLYGVSLIVGRLAVGWLVDRYWAPGVAAVSLSFPAIGCWLLMTHPPYALTVFAASLVGFAAGAELDLMSFLAARYFGVRHYAKIYAVLYAALAVAGGIAPPLFARVYDVTGSYRPGIIVASGGFLAGALILLLLGRYPRELETARDGTGGAAVAATGG